MSASPSKAPLTLKEFIRRKARAACAVCALSEDIRKQLGAPAAADGITRPEQVEWLRTVCGAATVTVEVLNKHLSARHDSEES